MKKLFYLVIILLAACTSNDDNLGENTKEQSEPLSLPKSLIRSVDDAMKIAQQSIAMLDKTNTRTDGSFKRRIDLANGVKTIVSNGTRSESSGRDTLMYVFNFENNEGFAVVAAPRYVEGLLAVTESGHYDLDTPSEIEGFEMFMDMAEKYVSGKNGEPFIQLIDSIVCIGHSYVGPYVTVRWGQSLPEGEFCPNGIAGCANTALAQIMSYYQHPQSIDLTYPGADKTNQQLNWSAMKSHPTGHSRWNCSVTDSATHTSIGRLCRQLGEMTNSDYSNWTSTSTPSFIIPSAITNLGYQTSTWTSYSESYIRNNLNDGKIMFIKGYKINENGGHGWVVDGYDAATYQRQTYAHPFGTVNPIWWLQSIGDPYTVYLYHFNWGWYGINNGYFNANVFDTSAVQFPDTDSNYANYNYGRGVELLLIWH